MFIGAGIAFGTLCLIQLAPESFRWQLAKGKTEEGLVNLQTFFSKCGVSVDSEVLRTLPENPADKTRTKPTKINDLVKSPIMMLLTSKLAYLWIVTSLSYYVLVFTNKGTNLLTDNIWSGIIEIAALVPGALCIQKHWCKRRWFLACLFLLAAFSLLLDAVFTQYENYELAAVFRLPGRGASVLTFAVIFVYTAEVYPTLVRSSGLGLCSVAGRLGGIFSPQIGRLGSFGYVWLPSATVAILLMMASFVS